HPIQHSNVDLIAGLEISRKIAEHSIVLLQNKSKVLPLDRNTIRSIAVIGEKADFGMISGGGSAQVDPPDVPTKWQEPGWFPTSPLNAVKAKLPKADVVFESGSDIATAAAAARKSDVAIVFAHQWQSEGMDLPSLSLPGDQDSLISQVATANPKTIVVLET